MLMRVVNTGVQTCVKPACSVWMVRSRLLRVLVVGEAAFGAVEPRLLHGLEAACHIAHAVERARVAELEAGVAVPQIGAGGNREVVGAIVVLERMTVGDVHRALPVAQREPAGELVAGVADRGRGDGIDAIGWCIDDRDARAAHDVRHPADAQLQRLGDLDRGVHAGHDHIHVQRATLLAKQARASGYAALCECARQACEHEQRGERTQLAQLHPHPPPRVSPPPVEPSRLSSTCCSCCSDMPSSPKVMAGSARCSLSSGRTLTHALRLSTAAAVSSKRNLEEHAESSTELLLSHVAVGLEEHVATRFQPQGQTIAKADA